MFSIIEEGGALRLVSGPSIERTKPRNGPSLRTSGAFFRSRKKVALTYAPHDSKGDALSRPRSSPACHR